MILITTFGWSLLNRNTNRTIITGVVGIFILIYLAYPLTFNPKKLTFASNISKLKSLPYLSYVRNDTHHDVKGVTFYIKNLSSSGINVYTSGGIPGAYLVDMSGKTLHRWNTKTSHWDWHYVRLYGQNDLLIIVKDNMFLRVDWDSKLKWSKKIRVHHDMAFDENKNIYVLARKNEIIFDYGLPLPILNDYIIVLNPKGKILKQISLHKILKNKINYKKYIQILVYIVFPKNSLEILKYKTFASLTPLDLFHTNTITMIDKDINGIFRKGNILFCSRALSTIGVINLKDEKLLWTWGKGHLEQPHHPTLLRNGNILIFDNGTTSRKFSRIIEYNPHIEETVWMYEGSPRETFFSSWGGACQILPNGNILITETDQGHVFEITRQGKIVWEFYNPMNTKNGRRGTIYRMMRIIDPFINTKLKLSQ
jgi:hypothetical protein